jgi:hypothetical protein
VDRGVTQNLTALQYPIPEGKALALLKDIVRENSKSLKLYDDRLSVTTLTGTKYSVELGTAKVFSNAGKFVCIRVLAPDLPIIDQVIAKSLYLISHPDPLLSLDHDIVFKLTFAGIEPNIEWPWIKSMSYSTLGDTFSSLIGADFAVKDIRCGDLVVKLQMWYVNYDDKFRSIRIKHIRGSMGGIVLCTNDCDPKKVLSVGESIDELRSSNGERLPIAFVGLYRGADECGRESQALKLGEEIARRKNIRFFACSLDHPSTTRKPFTHIIESILRRRSASWQGASGRKLALRG